MFFGRMVDDFFGRGTANLKSPWRLPLDIAMPDMLRGGPCRGDLFASFSPDDSKVGKSGRERGGSTCLFFGHGLF